MTEGVHRERFVLTDAAYEVDGTTYVRVRFGDGPWEMLTMDDYLKRLDEIALPVLSTTWRADARR